MGKWYNRRRSSRRRSSRRGNPAGLIAILVLIAIVLVSQYGQVVVAVAAVAAAIFLLVYFLKRNKQQETFDGEDAKILQIKSDVSNEPATHGYSQKDSIMTDCEKVYFKVFQEILAPHYTVQPQINLASIIDKDSQSRYRNELFRNIDFGVFDSNYSLILLIEINDQTHTQKNRRDRDNKVQAICQEAGIPLIAFWTKYGVNKQYIGKRLSEYLPLLNTRDEGEQ